MVEAVKLSDRYNIEGLIAHGGMGRVYTAMDERLNRRVAVKVLRDELATQPDFVERFRREARAVAALSHPNIASVYDYGEDDGRPYIVMELLEGRDLAQLLQEEGALPPERARHVATQLCDALGHAHASGVVHRDVKPANVIVAHDGHVKVTDFGIARVVDDTTLTAAGALLGTAQYLSPEQASGGRVGPPSDVYSAGIVLYEMLTGVPPFTGDTPVAVAMRHVSEAVPPPSRTRGEVPADLDEIVGRATQKEPTDRYASGNEMATALRGGAAPSTAGAVPTAVLARPAPTAVLPPTDEARRRQPSMLGKVVALAALLVALLAAGLLAATLIADRERRPQRERTSAPQREEATPPPAEAQTVTVPSGLVGSNVDEAEDVLEGAKLAPEKVDVPDDEPKDVVVETRPVEGTEVQPGATVVLFVSEGPPEEEGGDEGEEPPSDEGNNEGPGNSDDAPGNSEGNGEGKGKDKGKDKDEGEGEGDG